MNYLYEELDPLYFRLLQKKISYNTSKDYEERLLSVHTLSSRL